MSEERTRRIRELNDTFRTTMCGGRVYVTDGVEALGEAVKGHAIAKVIAFADFTDDNDPWGEHDFGSFEIVGYKFFWKIDYYDRRNPDLGAEDPSDGSTTERALTVMLAEEY